MILKAASWGCGRLRCAVCLFSPLGAAGFGSGMAYLPAVVMVGRYFQKARARPGSPAPPGPGSARSSWPVLLKYLCAEYGWRAAMFIQARVPRPVCVRGRSLGAPSRLGWSGGSDPEKGRRTHVLPAHSTNRSGPVDNWGPRGSGRPWHRGQLPRDGARPGVPGGKRRTERTCAPSGYGGEPADHEGPGGLRDWYSGYFGTASLFT